MREPASKVDDPLLEQAIEETRQFLARQMQSPFWQGDPNAQLISKLRAEIREIEKWQEVWPIGWNKDLAVLQLFEKTKKHLRKPTRNFRNLIIKTRQQISSRNSAMPAHEI